MYRVQLPGIDTQERRKAGRVVEVETWPGVVELQAQGGVLLDELHAETLRSLEGAPAEVPAAEIPPPPDASPAEKTAEPPAAPPGPAAPTRTRKSGAKSGTKKGK